MPTLEKVVQFTEQRQKLIAHNVANINTPYYKPQDAPVGEFQKAMQDAIDDRRGRINPLHGDLAPKDTRHIDFDERGVSADPIERHDNVLFHDRNDRDLERLMQDMVENNMAHNAAVQMLKSRMDLLGQAISLRV